MIKQVGTSKIHYFPSVEIGQGITSIVYQGFLDNGTIKTAVKKIASNIIKVHTREIKFITQLLASPTQSCRNLVVLYDMEETDGHFYFSVERATFSLPKFINQTPNLNIGAYVRIIEDISKGLQFLHENNVLHRNIKPENVLIFQDNQYILAKLSDFGVSCPFKINAEFTGSEDWTAPEAIKAKHEGANFKNSEHADIFSLGMTAYFTLSNGEHPFGLSAIYGIDKTMNIKDPYLLPAQLRRVTKNYTNYHLIKWMMQKITENRPLIQQVRSHPMFWDNLRYLYFICKLSITIEDSSVVDRMQKQNSIDKRYRHFYWALYKKDFNWIDIVDQRLLQHQGRKLKMVGKAHSLFSLVHLIANNNINFIELSPDLIRDRFMVNSKGEIIYSKQKYIEYFMELFPDMLIFLFCEFVDLKAPYFASFRETYYKYYDNVNPELIKSLLKWYE